MVAPATDPAPSALPAVLGETRCGMEAAGRHVGVDKKTIYRWITRGIVVGGERARLEAARLGGRYVTSKEALERFVNRMSQRSEVADPAPPAVAATPAPAPAPPRPTSASEAKRLAAVRAEAKRRKLI
jgi:hypothetical protein